MSTKYYSVYDINDHNKFNDCWISLNKNIYNISDYKNDVIQKNHDKNINLGVRCGTNYKYIKPNKVFHFKPNSDNGKRYKVGEIKYYLLYQILHLLIQVALFILLFSLTVEYKSPIFMILLMIFIMYKCANLYTFYKNNRIKLENIKNETHNDVD